MTFWLGVVTFVQAGVYHRDDKLLLCVLAPPSFLFGSYFLQLSGLALGSDHNCVRLLGCVDKESHARSMTGEV